ncbi:MAG TPA: 50S ribosomal protein L10 [Solirubrobacterales bacterium]|nr:50S ribosomal protein L10 [Solirubrobacterales bacterium]
MNRDEKQAAVDEIGEQLEASSAVFVVDYRGISVPQAAELRGKLREADASFSVVKNRLVKRITADKGAEALDEHLVGPTALTYVKGDAVVAAKAIDGFTKEYEILVYKGGIMDGAPLGADEFKAIAKLPGVEVLHGQLVGLAASPLTGLVSSLNGLVQGLASQLGQLAEQGLIGKDAPEPEPEAEAEAEAEPEADAEAEAPEAEAEAPAEAEGDEETSDEAEQEGADTESDAEETETDKTETKEDD